MKILLKIQYIGTSYSGFQCQKNKTAVQNVLTDAAERLFGFPCNVTGCSRTDAGVHALGFCCTVEPKEKTEEHRLRIPVGKIHRAFREYLPEDISVCAAAEMPDDFHPRYSAKGKSYIYRIWDAPFDKPFEKGRSMRNIFRISPENEEKMIEAAKAFVGKHDFSSFMATGSKITDANRTVFDAKLYRENGGALVFFVSADGFLYNMVRIMAGTLLDVAAGKIQPQDVSKIILAKDRAKAGSTAPACGLYLNEVFYDESIEWQCE